jgi:hypothetical protein
MLRGLARNRSAEPSGPLKESRLSKRNQAEKSPVGKRYVAKDISLPPLRSMCRQTMLPTSTPLSALATAMGNAGPEFVRSPIGPGAAGYRVDALAAQTRTKRDARRSALFQWAQ